MLAVVCNGVRRHHRELVGQLNEVEDNCESTNVCGTNCTQRVHKILTPHCYSQQLVTLWQLHMKSIEIIVIYSTIICKSGKMNHPKSSRKFPFINSLKIFECATISNQHINQPKTVKHKEAMGQIFVAYSEQLNFIHCWPYYLISGIDKSIRISMWRDNFVIFHVLTRFNISVIIHSHKVIHQIQHTTITIIYLLF